MKECCKIVLINLICYTCICGCADQNEASVSVLEGGNWRLSQIIKDGMPVSSDYDINEMSYTLSFYTDSNLVFHTSRNWFYNLYIADEKTNSIKTSFLRNRGWGDEVDISGDYFSEYMMNAKTFELIKGELKIFSDNDSYLLFIKDESQNFSHLYEAIWVLAEFKNLETGEQYDIDWNKNNESGQFNFWLTIDSLARAASMANSYRGSYTVNSKTIIFNIGQSTDIFEPGLGEDFFNALLHQEHIYEIKNKELFLQSEKYHLKFKPEKP